MAATGPSDGRLSPDGIRMDRQAIQRAITSLAALPFPLSPDDSDLGDWIVDLLEADTHYAGLAQSALAGAAFVHPPERDLNELAEWLEEIRVPTSSDQEILDACRTYFTALSAVHTALRS